MSEHVTIPAKLNAELAADLSAGNARTARWRPSIPAGALVLTLAAPAWLTTPIPGVPHRPARAGLIGSAARWDAEQPTLCAAVNLGNGGNPALAVAWALVGSAADPDSPRPSQGDRVLILDGAPGAVGTIGEWRGLFAAGGFGALLIRITGSDGGDAYTSSWAILPPAGPVDLERAPDAPSPLTTDRQNFQVAPNPVGRWRNDGHAVEFSVSLLGLDNLAREDWPDHPALDEISEAVHAIADRHGLDVSTSANSSTPVADEQTDRAGDKARAELAEMQALFDLQRTRMCEATDLWRAEDPDARQLILPDLGDLLTWLIGRVSPSALLAQFHTRPGVDIAAPAGPTLDVPDLDARLRYLREEVDELEEAITDGDLVSAADALADITYVVYGTAWRTGIRMDAVLAEVHRSNMTKTASPGDGKAIKGPGYSRPDVAGALGPQDAVPETT